MVVGFHNLSIKLNRPRSKTLTILKLNFIYFVINVFRCNVESLEVDLKNIDDSLEIIDYSLDVL
jgi:hypothetical protein